MSDVNHLLTLFGEKQALHADKQAMDTAWLLFLDDANQSFN